SRRGEGRRRARGNDLACAGRGRAPRGSRGKEEDRTEVPSAGRQLQGPRIASRVRGQGGLGAAARGRLRRTTRPVIALDTNILIYAHRADAPFHVAAKTCVTGLAEGRGAWAIPW